MKQTEMKRNAKKQIAMLLVCCMLFTLLPTTALASEPSTTVAKDITLGISAIQEPTEVTNDSEIYYTPSSYIYFGKNGTTDIKWRVLDADKANDGKTDGMFLLSEYVLATGIRFNANSSKKNQYQGSDAQTWCKNFAGSANFSPAEQNAIRGVAKTDSTEELYSVEWGASSLSTEDKLFFLSAEELANYVGNYDGAPGMVATDASKASTWWWLRSPDAFDTYFAGVIDDDGVVLLTNVDNYLGARPALNLNLSSVLFTSAAKGGKATTGTMLSSNADYSGNEYKLTLLDESRDFEVTQTTAKGDKGDTLEFEYKNAKTGSNEYISAMIVDETDGEVLYYGQIVNATTTSGMIDFKIPSDIDYGTYELKLFNEQINGDYKTDFSSDFQTITLSVEKPTATLVTEPTAKNLTYNGTAQELITAGSTTCGVLQYKVDDGTYSAAIPKGTEAGDYTVWYYVEGDRNHNDSAPQSIEVTIAPKQVYYGGGGYYAPEQEKDKTEETVWNNPFTDVHETDWFYHAVKYAHQNKLFAGMSATEFAPNMPMSRGMLVTVLYRLAGSPAVAGAMPFADVNSDAYYRNAILWAVQNNIVSGIGDNLFAPDANITREQIAIILYRFAQYCGYDTSVGEDTNILSYDDFTDINEYAITAMQYAAGSGFLNGRTESTLNPQDTATRAEVAAILPRFIEGNK